jgi:type II secretory pathway component PulM
MQDVYIKYLLRRLTDEFELGIQSKLETSFTVRLLIFFGFLLLLLTLYVLFWIPTISKLNTEVKIFSEK